MSTTSIPESETGISTGGQRRMVNYSKDLRRDILAITLPRGKLDPVAAQALAALPAKLIGSKFLAEEGPLTKVCAEEIEEEVHDFIVKRGIASKVNKVTERLNGWQMTDGQRRALASTYALLLAKLFREWLFAEDKNEKPEERAAIEDLMKDDLGVAESVMLDVQGDYGPLHILAYLVVEEVMKRNRIKENDEILDQVTTQVRGAI